MKRLEILSAIALMLFSGYVGFTTNYVNTATANDPPVLPRFTDVPRTNMNISLDLNSEKLVVSSVANSNINIDIHKKDSIIRTPFVVIKEVKVPYIVYQAPPVKAKQTSLASIKPFKTEKINLNR